MSYNVHMFSLMVVGHLPQKQQDYRKKYRTLASTYMTFGPDGKELLVNIGGEQIYLFDINSKRSPQRYDIGSQSSSHSHSDSKGTSGHLCVMQLCGHQLCGHSDTDKRAC